MKRYLPICLLLFSFSAHGALTKWVDADGGVHYSDGPPPENIKAKALAIPHDSISGVPAAKTYVEREAEMKKARKAKEEADQKAFQQQENALARQKNCAMAKSNLKTYEGSLPITAYNDKGESINIDDAARLQYIEETRKQISIYCD